MLPGEVSGDASSRTRADNQTVRNVWSSSPTRNEADPRYPMTTGRTSTRVLRVIDSLQLTGQPQVATPGSGSGATTDHRRSVSNDQAKEIYRRAGRAAAYIASSAARKDKVGS